MSVPLAYPPLLYLLVRMLMVARRRRSGAAGEPLRLLVPTTWLAVALVFLVGFRVGPQRHQFQRDRRGLRGRHRRRPARRRARRCTAHFPTDNQHGDTYGPVNYYAYVPFEQVWPWSGTLGRPPGRARRGRRVRPADAPRAVAAGTAFTRPALGWVLAYAWAAFPFTLYAANSNSNDGLVAMLVTLALLVARWAPARGAAVALAGLTKFAPLALAPVFAPPAPRASGSRAACAASRCSRSGSWSRPPW